MIWPVVYNVLEGYFYVFEKGSDEKGSDADDMTRLFFIYLQ